MLNHSRPQIRKRAILAIHKVLEKYPEAALLARPRLIEKLEDLDPGTPKIPCTRPLHLNFSRCCWSHGECAVRTRETKPTRLPEPSTTIIPPPDDLNQ